MPHFNDGRSFIFSIKLAFSTNQPICLTAVITSLRQVETTEVGTTAELERRTPALQTR